MTQRTAGARLRGVLPLLALLLALFGCQSLAGRSTAALRSTAAPPRSISVAGAVRPQPAATYPSGGAAPPLTASESRYIAGLMDAMSLEQKIGQHFIGHIPRSGLDAAMLAGIKRGIYGGFILYPWNYENEEDVRTLTATLQSAALEEAPPIGLFLAVDQEGGRVDAFRFPDLVQFPSQFDMGRFHDPGVAWSTGYIVGVELKSLGVNMLFAPVLDLYPKPDSTIIGDRSFGPDQQRVSGLGQAYIHGAQATGIIPVAKHFPGHGHAHLDSHYDLPIVEMSENQLMANDLVPFRGAVDAGVEAIMTAHVLFPKVDPKYPATLSRVFLKEILRKRFGFSGVIITDGLSMGALRKHFSLDETLKQALDAGVDVLLDNADYSVPTLVTEVEQLVRAGEVPMSALDQSTRRILDLKLRHGLIAMSPL